MNNKAKRLIITALRNARDYQESLAYAYGRKCPEAKASMKLANDFDSLRNMMCADMGIAPKTPLEIELETATRVDVSDLKNLKNEKD